jgi:predicted component of type VI protein secretion system
MVPKLVLPSTVSPTPSKELGNKISEVVAIARKPHLSLHAQVTALTESVAKLAQHSLAVAAPSAASSKNVNDQYDWFFLVERCENDSDVISLWSALQAMSEYAVLSGSSGALTHVEEMALVEALQAIVENMAEV